MVSFTEGVTYVLSVASFVMCVIILILYLLYPGTRIHPNQILINHAFADSLFAVAFLISRRLFLIGDTTCSSSLGLFASFLTQYSLMASETSYLFLAIDGLISVSRPFTDTQTRYTFYGIFVHTMGLVSALILLATHKTGKHVVDICWIQSGTPYINVASWEFLFVWVFLSTALPPSCLS